MVSEDPSWLFGCDMSTEDKIMSDDVVIDVRNVSKCYQLYDRPQDRLLQSLFRGRKKLFREFWSLNDVSMQVKRGEAVGIIGRNGAGKSTLLQIIASTLEPTTGQVTITGRISALLQLGSGFNPDFSGRENVYINGAILGVARQEIERRFDEIVEFAEMSEFIDQPIKTYSTGMVMRLAFAVSVCLSPDILIVDEALAVGDALFQMKCYARLKALRAAGTSLLFVSHDLSTVRSFCNKAIYLQKGKVKAWGEVGEVVTQYEHDCYQQKIQDTAISPPAVNTVTSAKSLCPNFPSSNEQLPTKEKIEKFESISSQGKRQGTNTISIVATDLIGQGSTEPFVVFPDKEATLYIWVRANEQFIGDIHFSMQIHEKTGTQVAVVRDSYFRKSISVSQYDFLKAEITFFPRLRSGEYYGTLGVLCFPPGEKYGSIGGTLNLEQLNLSDHVEIGIVFTVSTMHHIIGSPVLIEAKQEISLCSNSNKGL